jgi:hypothetical protein
MIAITRITTRMVPMIPNPNAASILLLSLPRARSEQGRARDSESFGCGAARQAVRCFVCCEMSFAASLV